MSRPIFYDNFLRTLSCKIVSFFNLGTCELIDESITLKWNESSIVKTVFNMQGSCVPEEGRRPTSFET